MREEKLEITLWLTDDANLDRIGDLFDEIVLLTESRIEESKSMSRDSGVRDYEIYQSL